MLKQKKLSFSWVLVDELMVGSAPRLEDDLKKLESEGIKSILTLCSNEEVEIPEGIDKLFFRESFVLPDHTFNTYPKPDEILEVLNILEKIMEHGPVYVHCFAGIERSPLICMAWLVKKHDMEVNESLRYMMGVHKKTNPLPYQIDCLHKLKKNYFNKS